MIRIDLLPPEYRRAERTAPATLLAGLGLVAFFCASAAAGAYGWFGVVGGARADVESARELLESKRPLAAYSDKLEVEKKEYTARVNHIKNFGDSRVLWTKKLDQIGSLVDTPPEEDRHLVWFDQLTMRMNGARDQGLVLKGNSASGEVRRLSNFHGDLSAGPFFADFTSISNPAGKVNRDEDFEPAEAWDFEFVLALKDHTGETAKKKTVTPPRPPAAAGK